MSRENRKSGNFGFDSGKAAAESKARGCPVCSVRQQQGTTEVYLISEGNEGTEGEDRYFFNVDKAKAIVSDGRAAVAIADSTLRGIVAVNECSRTHLAHVDPGRPGIMAQRFGGLVLLDGIHRAVRCLEEGRTFYAWMLDYQESLACLIRQEIASADALAIVAKLRKVMSTAPGIGAIEAEIECSPRVLAKVRRLLTAEEKRRFVLRAAGKKKRNE